MLDAEPNYSAGDAVQVDVTELISNIVSETLTAVYVRSDDIVEPVLAEWLRSRGWTVERQV